MNSRLYKMVFLHFPHPVWPFYCTFRTLYGRKNGSWPECIAFTIICEGKGLWDWNWGDIHVYNHYIKLVFWVFLMLHLPPPLQKKCLTIFLWVGNKMGNSGALPKLAQLFFPGKNRIWKIREKSRFEIPNFWDLILHWHVITDIFT